METKQTFSGEKYNLRWNSYKNSIVNYLAEHQSLETLVDVTLSCEGQFIRAHKLILSACSNYFKDLFQIHRVDHPYIVLNNVKFRELKYIIEFVYNGEIKVLDSDLESVLALGDNLRIKGLSNIREKKAEKLQEKIAEVREFKRKSSSSKDVVTEQLITQDMLTQQLLGLTQLPVDNKEENQTPEIRPPAKKRRRPTPASKSSAFQCPEEIPKIPILPSIVPEIEDVTGSVPPSMTSQLSQEAGSTGSASDDNEDLRKKTNKPVPKTRMKINKEVSEYDESHVRHTSVNIDFGNKVPRPPNAFMIFANEWRKKLAVEHPEDNNKSISVRLGSMWKNLSNETKDSFYEAARKANDEHKVKYPGYYYNPKEARMRKAAASFGKTGNLQDAMQLVKLVMTEDGGTPKKIKEIDVPEEVIPLDLTDELTEIPSVPSN